jgi:hypothetical protein
MRSDNKSLERKASKKMAKENDTGKRHDVMARQKYKVGYFDVSYLLHILFFHLYKKRDVYRYWNHAINFSGDKCLIVYEQPANRDGYHLQ